MAFGGFHPRGLFTLLAALTLSITAAGEARAESTPTGTGWALGAGIGGLALGAVTITLGAVGATAINADNEAERQSYGPLALAMTASAAAVTAIAAPLLWLGSRSARRSGAEGLPELRGVGWIFYSIHIAMMVMVTAMAGAEEQVDGWLSGVGGALGAISLNAFAIDAMLAWSQARRLDPTESEARARPLLLPVVALGSEARGLTVGLTAAF